ncbi:hypothetical protein [Micromonospora coerulea]|uniref:hypothetical protein n=1 Tax=Micromonospora coerulea TaxID=47856 RepID=UPI0031F83189
MSVTDQQSSESPARPYDAVRVARAAVAPMDARCGGTTMISVAVTGSRPGIVVESVA